MRVENNDDNLVASCLSCRNLKPDANVVLIAGDTGPRLKARQHGIEAVAIPEKYKLESALDDVEKEKRKLQRRVQQLENRFPKLKLAFANEANQFSGTLLQPVTMPEEEIQRRVKGIKNKYRKREQKPAPKGKPSQDYLPSTGINKFQGLAGKFNDFSGPSPEEIKRYNSDLEKFYGKYETYLREYIVNANLQRRTLRLDLRLFNIGTAPAEDIDIFLHFPDGFNLYDEDDKPEIPEVPDSPPLPRNRGELLYSPLLTRDFSSLARTPHYLPTQSNVSAPEIKRSNSYKVAYEVERLKQHMNESLDPLYVVFDSVESAASFRVDYRINVADLPDETTGALHVTVATASDNK